LKFNYQAKDKQGRVQSGVVEASSREVALQILDRYGLYVTILEKAASGSLFSKRIAFFDKVSMRDIMIFSRELSIMFKSEVPLVESLRAIGEQTKAVVLKEKIMEMAEQVESGTAFSTALEKHKEAFSSFYINMVRSGEASGTLSDVLNYLADHVERDYELSGKLKAALIYPAFVIVMAIGVIVMMLVFVVPNIVQVIAASGGTLPLPTRIVIGLSNLVQNWWWLFLLLTVAGLVWFGRYRKTLGGKKRIDEFMLKLPIFGSFLRTIYLSSFAENLSTLSAGGISIVEALEITGRIVGNVVYEGIVRQAIEAVKRGERISVVLRKHPNEFPPIFTQMVAIGERSCSLDTTLGNVVGFYQKEVERTIEGLLSLLEPMLIVILGVVVGGIMAAILLPLYQSMGT